MKLNIETHWIFQLIVPSNQMAVNSIKKTKKNPQQTLVMLSTCFMLVLSSPVAKISFT